MKNITPYDSVSDSELVKLALDGHSEAFDVLCRRYEVQIMSMLSGRGVVNCDDIVQESFIKAFLNLDKFNPSYSFGQWIFTIAKNMHIDTVRKSKNNTVDIEEVITFSGSMNPEQSYISQQTREVIEKKLANLPVGYREIVEMRFLDEMAYDEIAQKLNIPIGTVKTKIHRARALLVKQN